MGRLAAIDEQVGILLKGDGRASSGLTHSLAAIQNELGGLAVALKELAHLREGQEGAQREMEAIRSELAAMREELTGLAPVQETLARLTRRVEGEEEVHPEESRLPRGITIEPIRPRLVLSEIDESGLESVLKLDAD